MNFDRLGLLDISESLKRFPLPLFLAWADIRQRYRRSLIGPFWITLSTAVLIATIGFIFGNIFHSTKKEFLPYLTSGLILWTLISSSINESSHVFSSNEAIIRQLPIPLFVHVMRMLARNLYIFLHNFLIFPVVCFFCNFPINFSILFVIPGLFLLLINLAWLGLVVAIICTRFRDLSQIVASILQVLFYVTPIIWLPNLMTERVGDIVLNINPFFHLIQIVREPLLGNQPSLFSLTFSFVFAVVGWLFTIYLFNNYRRRIPYWL